MLLLYAMYDVFVCVFAQRKKNKQKTSALQTTKKKVITIILVLIEIIRT